MKIRTLLLALLCAQVTGCALGYHGEAGPVVTTEGDVGLVARAGFSIGVEVGDDQGLLLVWDGGLGPSLDSGRGVLTGAVGFDYVHQKVVRKNFALRAGFRGRVIGFFDGDGFQDTYVAPGLALGFLFPTGNSRHDRFENLGFSLEAGPMSRASPAGEGVIGGLCMLSFVYEWNGFSDPF